MNDENEKSKCCGYEPIQMSDGTIACAHCRKPFEEEEETSDCCNFLIVNGRCSNCKDMCK